MEDEELKGKLEEEDITLLKKMISVSNMQNFKTLPNFLFRALRPPSGYIASIDEESKMYSDMFMTNWYEGITVKSLPEMNVSYINKKKVKEVIQALFGRESEKHPSIYDNSSDWTCEVSGENNFIGIFCCKYEDSFTNELENRWFVACKSGLPKKTYYEFCDYLDKCTSEGQTYKQFLEDKKGVIKRVKLISEENRKRVLYTFCAAIGIHIQSRVSSKTDEQWKSLRTGGEVPTAANLVKIVKELYSGLEGMNGKFKIPLWFKHEGKQIGQCLNMIKTKNKAAYEKLSRTLNIEVYDEPYVAAGCDINSASNFFNENNYYLSEASDINNSYGAIVVHDVNGGSLLVFGTTPKHSAFFKGSGYYNLHQNACPTTVYIEKRTVSSVIKTIMKNFGLKNHKVYNLVPLLTIKITL